jgi:hypothetical protein
VRGGPPNNFSFSEKLEIFGYHLTVERAVFPIYGRLDNAQNRYPVIFSCIKKWTVDCCKKESVYLNKKIHKNQKWGTGGLVTHQKYFTVTMDKILEGSDSSSCTGGKMVFV